jgi:D-amino peptidase
MKIFLHWDMEGAGGLFSREQTWFWEPGVREEVAREGRELLIADVNAASVAALHAGADEVIVCDTHHGGGNLDVAMLLADPRITYLFRSVGSQDGERRWMPGLDHGVDALMLLGHHAKAGSDGAFLPHTWTLDWADFLINGRSVGELGIEACFAGHWDIPVILVQGDQAACDEARAQFPGVVTVAVKHAVSHDLCTGLDAAAARRFTAEKICEAIARVGTVPLFKPSLPMTVSIRMASVAAAEKAAKRPGVRRVDDVTVEGHAARHCDVVSWINGTGLAMATI